MSVIVGLHLGNSFCQAVIREGSLPVSPPLSENTFFLGSVQGFEQMKQWLLKELNGRPAQICIVCQNFEQMFSMRLGGKVAQIVNRGLEEWLVLRQPYPRGKNFLIPDPPPEPMGNQDYVFGIDGRIDQRGIEIEPLNPDQLISILSKIKKENIERVAINLLFGHLNKTHALQIKDMCTQMGLQVFSSTEENPPGIDDEAPRWRRNLLSACLWGTQNEWQKRFLDLAEKTVSSLHYAWQTDFPSDACTSAATSMGRHFHHSEWILNLGLEKWSLVCAKAKTETWESPWGTVMGTGYLDVPTELQPCSKILFDSDFETFALNIGFDPGPIAMGRGIEVTWYDILRCYLNQPLLGKFEHIMAYQKIQERLVIFAKFQGQMKSEKLVADLYRTGIELLAAEVCLNTDGKVFVTGTYAPFLFESLKKALPQIEIILDPLAKYSESFAATEIVKTNPDWILA